VRPNMRLRCVGNCLTLASILLTTLLSEASAAGVGETCGGIANIPCDAGLWCEPPAGQCAGADIAAKCIRVPDICYQLMKPVCGATG
jgi:hypothetical protein